MFVLSSSFENLDERQDKRKKNILVNIFCSLVTLYEVDNAPLSFVSRFHHQSCQGKKSSKVFFPFFFFLFLVSRKKEGVVERMQLTNTRYE